MRRTIMVCGLLAGVLLLGLGALLLARDPGWLQRGWIWNPFGDHAVRSLGIVTVALGALCVGGSLLLARRVLVVGLLLGLVDVAGLVIVYVSPDVGPAMCWYAAPAVLLAVAVFLAAIQLGRETEALPLDAPSRSDGGRCARQ